MKALCILLALLLRAGTTLADNDTLRLPPCIKVEAERLPDLNVPRVYNGIYMLNGELTVMGGHTTGFIPTPTAEYLKDGEWHLLPMLYSHDNGIIMPLRSGKVLLAGGHKENLGIGQSFEVEMYDPASHSFTGFGCLDRKRALACGVETDSGRVVIAGNWYADDDIEVFDGKKNFTRVKDVTMPRMWPYLFLTATGDVLVFASEDHRGKEKDTIVIDRLRGEPFTVPLFSQWRPMTIVRNDSRDCFIGDEAAGRYAYLLPVKKYEYNGVEALRQGRPAGETALALVEDTVFTLLPTDVPIPQTTAVGGPVFYCYTFLADRKAQRAYLLGRDVESRLYVVAIDYTQRPARLTLNYTDPLPDCRFGSVTLTDDGNLVIAGGGSSNGIEHDNFKPSASVYLIRLNPQATDAVSLAGRKSAVWPWVLVLLALAVVIGCLAAYFIQRRRKQQPQSAADEQPQQSAADEQQPQPAADEELLARICQLMEKEQSYLNPDLKLTDVADRLVVNPRRVSACIKDAGYNSFNQFVNNYRVAYVQQLLREQPDRKMFDVCQAAGFPSESSFFRIFKTVTAMTPREWLEQI